jgi:hypothetical protein
LLDLAVSLNSVVLFTSLNFQLQDFCSFSDLFSNSSDHDLFPDFIEKLSFSSILLVFLNIFILNCFLRKKIIFKISLVPFTRDLLSSCFFTFSCFLFH